MAIIRDNCQNVVYTRKSNILQAQREANNPARVTRANVDIFQFKEICICCAKDISEFFKAQQSKKPKDKRESLHEVMGLNTIQNIRAAAKARGEAWGEDVLRRFATEIDLIATEGRYHTSRRTDFFVRPDSSTSTVPTFVAGLKVLKWLSISTSSATT